MATIALDAKPIEKQSLRQLALMAFTTLGVIYSDIGTSPLYVLNGIFPASGPVPSSEDVIGALSAIVWSLTLIPLVKYAIIALRFGTGQGEGGPFAVFTSLYPGRDEDGDDIAAITTHDARGRKHDEPKPSRVVRTLGKPFVHWSLLSLALFAVALTLSDGALTPAVSVITAAAGLAIGVSSLDSNAVVGITIGILVALYLVQRAGTARISFVFAPCVAVWLLIIGISGIYNFTAYPGVWRAFDPSRLVLFFVRTGDFTVLGGVLLAVTGSEAFFACLGQFNSLSISLAFSLFVYPCVVCAYLGQGAQLIVRGEDVLSNVFYQTIPGGTGGGLYWLTFVFAIFAAIIASQAMITASFSLLVQLMSFHCLPALRSIRTSNVHHGQVYVPGANWVLMVASVALVGGFGTSTGLTNAYGFAVSAVFFVTTIFLSLAMLYRNKIPAFFALAFFLVFGFFDGLFFAASLYKVPDGAYVPLAFACGLALLFIAWSWAKGLELTFSRTNRIRLASLLGSYKDQDETLEEDDVDHADVRTRASGIEIAPLSHTGPSVVDKKLDEKAASSGIVSICDSAHGPTLRLRGTQVAQPLARMSVLALFHKDTPGTAAPASFEKFLRAYPALPSVVVFLAVKLVATPSLDVAERYTVHKIRSVPGFYRATARFGYRDVIDLQGISGPLVEQIVAIEVREGGGDSVEAINTVRAAAQSAVTHILSSYTAIAAPSTVRVPIIGTVFSHVRAFFLESLYSRVSLLFPEDDRFLLSDQVIRVAVPAVL